MSNVIIHANKRAKIHWLEANFAWDSPDGYKSWDDFWFIDYDALVEDSLNLNNEFDYLKGRALFERFRISTTVSKNLKKSLLENLMIMSRGERIAHFVRSLEEQIYLSRDDKKRIVKNFNEGFKIVDDWIRKANAVYSDLAISNKVITPEFFEQTLKRGAPIGYQDFTTYIPGYYEFESAMFRMVLRSVGLDRIRLTKLKMVVDVPDVFDRGDNIVDAGAPTVIQFNRKYIKPPKVIAIQNSGLAEAKLTISDVTKTEFKAALTDPSGNIVPGAISWISEGY